MKCINKSDDRGFSLIELIVVVLIMGILAVSASMAVTVIYNADAKRCAENVRTAFSQARARSLALGSEQNTDADDNVTISLKFTLDDDKYYYARIYRSDDTSPIYEYKLGSERGLGKSGLSILAGPKNSSPADRKTVVHTGAGITLGADEIGSIEYRFSRSTGGITQAGLAGGDLYDIIVNGSEVYKIIIAQATGRCYIYGEE